MLLIQTFDCICLCYFQMRNAAPLFAAQAGSELPAFRHQVQQAVPSGLFRQYSFISHPLFSLKKAVPQEEAGAKEITEALWLWLKAA